MNNRPNNLQDNLDSASMVIDELFSASPHFPVQERITWFKNKFFHAVRLGVLEDVNYLLEKKKDLIEHCSSFDIAYLDFFPQTNLHCYDENSFSLQNCLFFNVSFLQLAAVSGRVEIVKRLLEEEDNKISYAVAPHNQEFGIGKCGAIYFAVVQNHVEVVKLLLDKDDDLEAQEVAELLFIALSLGFKEIAISILNHKNFKDEVSWHGVIDPKRPEMYKLMLENNKVFDGLRLFLENVYRAINKYQNDRQNNYDYQDNLAKCRETVLLLLRAGYGIFANFSTDNFPKVNKALKIFDQSSFEPNTLDDRGSLVFIGMNSSGKKVFSDDAWFQGSKVITTIAELELAIINKKKLDINEAHCLAFLTVWEGVGKFKKGSEIEECREALIENNKKLASNESHDKRAKLNDTSQVENQNENKININFSSLKDLAINATMQHGFFKYDFLTRRDGLPRDLLYLFPKMIQIKQLLEEYFESQRENEREVANTQGNVSRP